MKEGGESLENERILIEKASKGDKESFEKIINIYKNYVFAIILNFIKDSEEAQNIAQEVFLQIYISLPKFQEDNFKAWISRITTNKAIDLLRKKRSRVKESQIDELENTSMKTSSYDSYGPESLLIDKENREEIRMEIDSLPEIYRDTVIRFYFEEKSYEEIALEDKVAIKTVESRLYRGRLLLKKNWRD